jgi:nitrite reductase/ring-hydroxylating ferredoxin subunit
MKGGWRAAFHPRGSPGGPRPSRKKRRVSGPVGRRLQSDAVAHETPVARVGEVAPGRTKKFLLEVDGQEVEAFLLNVAGTYHAYVNRCRHVPMGLDWVENQFFTEDARYIQCATHGAYYVPETGECIAGPPCGKSLVRVPLRLSGDTIMAITPTHLPDDR